MTWSLEKLTPEFKIISKLTPQGDQPAAIEQLTENLRRKQKYNVLLGVTGSGKTFTMANVIERMQKPTLVISHNKTLAAQLYEEFKELFPENAVRYVSMRNPHLHPPVSLTVTANVAMHGMEMRQYSIMQNPTSGE